MFKCMLFDHILFTNGDQKNRYKIGIFRICRYLNWRKISKNLRTILNIQPTNSIFWLLHFSTKQTFVNIFSWCWFVISWKQEELSASPRVSKRWSTTEISSKIVNDVVNLYSLKYFPSIQTCPPKIEYWNSATGYLRTIVSMWLADFLYEQLLLMKI